MQTKNTASLKQPWDPWKGKAQLNNLWNHADLNINVGTCRYGPYSVQIQSDMYFLNNVPQKGINYSSCSLDIKQDCTGKQACLTFKLVFVYFLSATLPSTGHEVGKFHDSFIACLFDMTTRKSLRLKTLYLFTTSPVWWSCQTL